MNVQTLRYYERRGLLAEPEPVRSRWHRLELDAPSDLMSMALRYGTRLEKRTATH